MSSASTSSEPNRHVQPFLIFSKSSDKFFIQADQYLIYTGRHFLTAMDLLIKLHYVFDIQFAAVLENFYNFLSTCVMENADFNRHSVCDALNTTFIIMMKNR